MRTATLRKLLTNPQILHDGHPILRQRATPASKALRQTDEFARLIDVMVEKMRAAPGVGLAAPQIGVSLRTLVMEDKAEYIDRLPKGVAEKLGRRPFPLTVLVNPEVRFFNEEQACFREACLSVPGVSGEVVRKLQCEVEALGRKGEKVCLQLEGWPARILQHELDHLDGVLYTDKVEPGTLQDNPPVVAQTDASTPG